MVLECPKCKKKFTIFDSIDKLTQTCGNETCKALISIRRLEMYKQQNISIYEIKEVVEDCKVQALDPFAEAYC